MPSILSADDIIEIAGGRLAQGLVPGESGRVVTDTRQDMEGAWFLALQGSTYDGHDFLGDAYSGGAIGCIVEERQNYPLPAEAPFPLIAVPETLIALRDLARNWRRRLALKMILVVSAERDRAFGLASYTSKILSSRFPTKLIDFSTSPGNPLSELIALDETTQFVVASMVPPSIDDVLFQSPALAPNTLVFTDEPFSYMRLTTSPEDLDKGVTNLLSSMDRRPGMVLACGTAAAVIRGFEMPANVTFKAYPGAHSTPNTSTDGEEHFMPSTEESWCVAEVCKDCGIPDDIIYGAFV
jgi:UDP-N-acetylmuramoyl-tripeptide--D-alanyl-D-alanine ligase